MTFTNKQIDRKIGRLATTYHIEGEEDAIENMLIEIIKNRLSNTRSLRSSTTPVELDV